ncbi:MAG: hypothetical protein U0324_46990 [Polyangiales bacterium]
MTATATLRIRNEGGGDVASLIAALERAVVGYYRRTESAARGSRQRTEREESDSARRRGGVYRTSAAEEVRTVQGITRFRLRQLALTDEARKRSETLYAIMLNRATRAMEVETGRRGELTERERRAAEDLARAMVVQHERAERARTAATAKAERERQAARSRFVAGLPQAAASAARGAAAAFADYGDDVRAKRQAREAVEVGAVRIAASDIGDASAASQLSEATRRVSELTGLDPQGVIDAIGAAQANFSALADAADRGTYLNDVLPLLAQAAAASGTSLTDMVNSAGEFQRQLGVTTAQLPQALAQAIQAGRLGSISFGDQARHMGVIGGGAARFLSSRPGDSLQSLATTNALFQFAGRAGGGGDISATRARAFLDNFTSAKGQRGLREALGYRVMGADGQIVTREGESQSQAFQRVIQDVYRRSGGNATRFLDTMVGSNTRGRALGDQLFRDLRAHGGRLSEFGDLVNQQMRGTVESTITRPFAAVSATDANQRSRREVRELYGLTGDATRWATDSERQLADLRAAHPELAGVVERLPGAEGARTALDLTNFALQAAATSAPTSGPRRPRTRAALQRAIAEEAASASLTRDFGESGFALDEGTRAQLMQRRTAEGMARLQLRDQAVARGESPTRISEESIARLANEIALALARNPVTIDQQTAVQASMQGPRPQ